MATARPETTRPTLRAELKDLVWPAACPGCAATGAGAAPACRGCLLAFREAAKPTAPTPPPAWLPAMWAVADYDGSTRAVMLAYKEHGSRRLAGPLGTALAAGLAAALAAAAGGRRRGLPPAAGGAEQVAGRVRGNPGSCVVVPMPSSAAARRQRGDDPVLRLARVAVTRLRAAGVPATLVPALAQLSGVLDQAGLSATERIRNLAGALELRPAAERLMRSATTVLLADDIVTTGATLAEATRVLVGADLPVRGAAVVAATRRRDEPSPGQPAHHPPRRLA